MTNFAFRKMIQKSLFLQMGKTSRLTFPQPSQFLHLSIVVAEPENAIWPGEELQHQEEDNDGWSQSAINHCEIILMKEVKCDCG